MKNSPQDPSVINVAVVDDHILVTSGVAEILNKLSDIRVTLQAISGEELLQLLKKATDIPDILLMDVSMKGMSGIDATKQVTALYPLIKIIALTGMDDEATIIQMIRAGCCAYLKKEIHPLDLEDAIRAVYRSGRYEADIYHLNARTLDKYEKEKMQVEFTPQEIRFLQLSSKGLTHREIGEELFLSTRSVDHYRAALFEKLGVNKGITMVLEAMRRGVIKMEPE